MIRHSIVQRKKTLSSFKAGGEGGRGKGTQESPIVLDMSSDDDEGRNAAPVSSNLIPYVKKKGARVTPEVLIPSRAGYSLRTSPRRNTGVADSSSIKRTLDYSRKVQAPSKKQRALESETYLQTVGRSNKLFGTRIEKIAKEIESKLTVFMHDSMSTTATFREVALKIPAMIRSIATRVREHEECKVTHYNAFGMETKLYNAGDIVEGKCALIRRHYFELIWLLAYNHHHQDFEIVFDKSYDDSGFDRSHAILKSHVFGGCEVAIIFKKRILYYDWALSHSTSQEKQCGADCIVLSDNRVGIVNGKVAGYVQKVRADFVKCYESGKKKHAEEDVATPTVNQTARIKGMIKTLKTIEDSIRRSKVNVGCLSMKGLQENITGCGPVMARRVHDLMRKSGSFSKAVMIVEYGGRTPTQPLTQPLVMATYFVRMWEIKPTP